MQRLKNRILDIYRHTYVFGREYIDALLTSLKLSLKYYQINITMTRQKFHVQNVCKNDKNKHVQNVFTDISNP